MFPPSPRAFLAFLTTERLSTTISEPGTGYVKSQSARGTQSQFAREGVGLCPFRGSYVRKFELSHRQQSSKQDYKNNLCAQFAREDIGLCPFSKKANCSQENLLKRF